MDNDSKAWWGLDSLLHFYADDDGKKPVSCEIDRLLALRRCERGAKAYKPDNDLLPLKTQAPAVGLSTYEPNDDPDSFVGPLCSEIIVGAVPW